MSDKFWENFTIDPTTANNSFSALWGLSRVIKAAGGIFKACGDGTTKVTTGVATDDLWGNNANPLLDAYAGAIQAQLDTRAAWWCAELPSTVKLGIGAASVGTFIRGETVTQATSGATGEFLGYVINSANNSGWVIIMPMTGTFDATHQIVGGRSAATVTATSYNLLRRQIVIAKNTTVTAGWIFYEALTQAEITASSNTALFSELAANAANCTATVAPGNSASGSNRWPSYGIPAVGTPESTGQAFFGITTGFGHAQMACTNLTPSAGVSVDGTFFVSIWDTANSLYRVLSLQRLDKTEPGDIDPFIITSATSEVATSATTGRVAATTSGATTAGGFYGLLGTGTGIPAKGYCARATGTMGSGLDVYEAFVLGGTVNVGSGSLGQFAMSSNASHPPKIRNHPDAAGGTGPYPIERLEAAGITNSITMKKGVCRHLALHPAANINATVEYLWLVVVPNNGTTNPALIIGPLDGITTPTTT
jgi:hypothetical protein